MGTGPGGITLAGGAASQCGRGIVHLARTMNTRLDTSGSTCENANRSPMQGNGVIDGNPQAD